MLASLCGDDTPGCGAACVVNFLDERVFDDCAGHFCGVLSAMEDYVEDASRKTGFLHDGANGPEATGGELRAFEYAGVATCESVGYGAEAEDVGSVPGDFSILDFDFSDTFSARREEGLFTMGLCRIQRRKVLCILWRSSLLHYIRVHNQLC